jgi:OOP family OmpA-OmpF porin
VEQIQTEGAVAFSSNVVRFDYGSWKLRDSSHRQLLEIAAALNDPSLEDVPFFYVDGHTCNIGTESNNCALSWRRALSVINFLVNAGDIPPQRLVPRGFGPHDAVKSNNTEEGRKQNRRVVLKKGPLQDEEEREKVCPPVESGNQ